MIGDQAEDLAHLYAGLHLDSFFRSLRQGPPYSLLTRWRPDALAVGESRMREVGAIVVANWLEQFPRMRTKTRASRIEDMRHLALWLGGAAGAALDEIYGFGRPGLTIDRAAGGDPTSAQAIEVWDDAVPRELQIRLSGLMDLNIWRYGWKASPEQSAYGFWHSHFGGDGASPLENCEHELLGRPMIAPVLDLWRMLQAGPLRDHVAVRVYANGHTFGGDGHLHQDHTEPGHCTTIYYAHPEWKPNWAGETVFFNEAQDDVIRSVFPKPGRLVHFPGHIFHAARSPGRECPTLRAVLVFKSRPRRPDEA